MYNSLWGLLTYRVHRAHVALLDVDTRRHILGSGMDSWPMRFFAWKFDHPPLPPTTSCMLLEHRPAFIEQRCRSVEVLDHPSVKFGVKHVCLVYWKYYRDAGPRTWHSISCAGLSDQLLLQHRCNQKQAFGLVWCSRPFEAAT